MESLCRLWQAWEELIYIWKLLLDCDIGKQISTNKNKEDNKPNENNNWKKHFVNFGT